MGQRGSLVGNWMGLDLQEVLMEMVVQVSVWKTGRSIGIGKDVLWDDLVVF